MSQSHQSPDFESLPPPLEVAVQAALAEPVPADAVERVKARAKSLATRAVAPARIPLTHYRGWRSSRAVVAALTLAAALLILVTGILDWLDGSAGRAFAQVIENVQGVGSVRLKMTTRFGRQREIAGQMHLSGNRLRLEHFDGKLIQVGDLDLKQALYLDMARQLAQPVAIDANLAREFANPLAQLRHAKSSDAEPLGQEILRGRRTQLYRLSKVDLLGFKGDAQMLVWVDVESQFPAKIVIRDANPRAEMEVHFDEFVWNEPLDAGLFSLRVPAGFESGIVVTAPRPSAPVEPDATAPAFAGGVLHDRVPGHLVWQPQGAAITALMRDPETVSPPERRPHTLRQWDVATGRLRWSQVVDGAGWVAGTQDGKTLATVIGYEVQLRNAETGEITHAWTTDEPLGPLAFSPNGQTLAAGIAEWGPAGGRGEKASGGVQFWDVARGNLVRSIADDKPVTFVRYSIDGNHLATSSNDGPIKLWAAQTGELTRVFPGRAGADFAPDGETLAVVSASPATAGSGTVELYQLSDGSLVKSFTSEPGTAASYLLSVSFAPDGRMLAATDWNGTVTVWDVASGERKVSLTDSKAGVLCGVFAPHGRTLALGSEDKTLRLWELPAAAK